MLYIKKIGFYWWETTAENWKKISELKKEYKRLLREEKRDWNKISEVEKEHGEIWEQIKLVE